MDICKHGGDAEYVVYCAAGCRHMLTEKSNSLFGMGNCSVLWGARFGLK